MKKYHIKTRMVTKLEYVNVDTGEMLFEVETKELVEINKTQTYRHTKNGITIKTIRREYTEHGKQLRIL